jgi:hypothetical protein
VAAVPSGLSPTPLIIIINTIVSGERAASIIRVEKFSTRVRFQVLTAVTIMSTIWCDVKPCSLVYVYRSSLLLQGQGVN